MSVHPDIHRQFNFRAGKSPNLALTDSKVRGRIIFSPIILAVYYTFQCSFYHKVFVNVCVSPFTEECFSLCTCTCTCWCGISGNTRFGIKSDIPSMICKLLGANRAQRTVAGVKATRTQLNPLLILSNYILTRFNDSTSNTIKVSLSDGAIVKSSKSICTCCQIVIDSRIHIHNVRMWPKI